MKFKRLGLFVYTFLISNSLSAQSHFNQLLAYQDHYKKELHSIIKDDTAFVKFYPIDSSLKIVAKLEKLNNQPFFSMATSDGKAHQAVKFAKVLFKLNGQEYSLFAYQLSFLLDSKEYKENFFIPFTDATSGIDSYGGGRYIDLTIKDISSDNIIVIDFNKAYNPYCAFRSGFSCPIPPKENYLPAEILAGEMDFFKL